MRKGSDKSEKPKERRRREREVWGGFFESAYVLRRGREQARHSDVDRPGLKKQIDSLHKQLVDLQRKETNCVKFAAEQQRMFERECEKLGIKVPAWPLALSSPILAALLTVRLL